MPHQAHAGCTQTYARTHLTTENMFLKNMALDFLLPVLQHKQGMRAFSPACRTLACLVYTAGQLYAANASNDPFVMTSAVNQARVVPLLVKLFGIQHLTKTALSWHCLTGAH